MPPRTLLIGLILGTLLGSALGYIISTTMLKQSDPYATISAKETQITQLNQQISNKNSQIDTLQKQILSLKAEDLRLIAVSFPRVDDTSSLIRNWISRANTSIDVAIYSFTRDSIADALIEAKTRGVKVRVLMELDKTTDDGSEYLRLKTMGVSIKPDSSQGLMHDKFFVIDGRIIGTGSFNWTSAAENDNAENLIIVSSEVLASKYLREFDVLWTS